MDRCPTMRPVAAARAGEAHALRAVGARGRAPPSPVSLPASVAAPCCPLVSDGDGPVVVVVDDERGRDPSGITQRARVVEREPVPAAGSSSTTASRKRQPPATASAPGGIARGVLHPERRVHDAGKLERGAAARSSARRRPARKARPSRARERCGDATRARTRRRRRRAGPGEPDRVAGDDDALPPRRSSGTAAGSLAERAPAARRRTAAGSWPVGRPIQAISPSTGSGRIGDVAIRGRSEENSRSKRGDRAESSRPSRRENVRTNGLPPSGLSVTETLVASAGPRVEPGALPVGEEPGAAPEIRSGPQLPEDLVRGDARHAVLNR